MTLNKDWHILMLNRRIWLNTIYRTNEDMFQAFPIHIS